MKNLALKSWLLFLLAVMTPRIAQCQVDVTFVSLHRFADGIGRRVIGQIAAVKDALNVNFICTRPLDCSDDDIDASTLAILHDTDRKQPGTVMFFLDSLHALSAKKLIKLTTKHPLRFVYLTVESTKAPPSRIPLLNEHFDAVFVPDPFCITSLKNSGVTIPVFVLPEICHLQDFLSKPLQQEPHKPFTFGVSATALHYKNYGLLLEAFEAEFKNSPNVLLKIHNHRLETKERIKEKIKNLRLRNVIDTHGPLEWHEYVDHMSRIDCYVLLSKGEGFSITPREALALGRPCILANHTAHKTICDTGYVYSVDAPIIEKHDAENYDHEDMGNIFNCELISVRKALREVYENYTVYLQKAAHGREWVKKYLAKQLRSSYLTVLKPHKVTLSTRNEITQDGLITDSEALYKKYQEYIIEPKKQAIAHYEPTQPRARSSRKKQKP